MITHVSLVTLWVRDQDAAKAFWVDVMGFEERTDTSMGEGFRWVTVGPPRQPEVQVTLMVPGPPLDDGLVEAVRRAQAAGTMPGFGVTVDDCRAEHQRLRGLGVDFVQEPADRPYGVEAVMRDESGNWLVLVEPRDVRAGAVDGHAAATP